MDLHNLDANVLCRTCLKIFSDDTLDTASKHDIFLTPDMVKKLVLCTSLTLEPQDGFPKHLCNDCYTKVNAFHEFQTMCVESVQRYGELLKLKPNQDELHFEDETPICCDLETKLEITIGEADVLCPNEDPEPLETDVDTDDDTDRKRKRRRRKQKPKAKSFKITKPKRPAVQSKMKTKKLQTAIADDKNSDGNANKEKDGEKEDQPPKDSSKHFCKEPGCICVYKNKKSLNMHLRKVHKIGPEVPIQSHVCEICGTVFKFLKDLNVHRYTHKDNSERPYVCERAPECQRRFTTKGKLKVHMLRHAGIKNYVCPHCGLRKTTHNELKVHINYHTLERTWPCTFCDTVCKSAVNLKVHERSEHGREKEYACRFCAKTFAKSTTRKYHEMAHTGENPNSCTECGKRYIQPNALQNHVRKHHSDQFAIQAEPPQTTTPLTP